MRNKHLFFVLQTNDGDDLRCHDAPIENPGINRNRLWTVYEVGES